jgi:hypothetical protein
MKKPLKILTVMVLAILTGSFLMMGCSNPADGSPGLPGGAGSPGVATFPGGGSPELLEAYFKSANVVFLEDDLSGSGVYEVPAGKTLAIVGKPALTGGAAINAFYGNLDITDAVLGFGSGGVIIVSPAQKDAVEDLSAATVPAYVAAITADQPADPFTEDVVVEGLGIGLTGGPSAARLATLSAGHTVFVVGKATIDGTTAVTITSSLVLLGETEAEGTVTLVSTMARKVKVTDDLTIAGTGQIGLLDLNGKKLTAGVTVPSINEITSTASGGTIALGAGDALPEVTVGATDITVTTTAVTLTVAELSTTGAGKLVIPAAAVTFTATAGGGKFAYAANPTGDVILSSVDGLSYVGALGLTGDLTITGDAEFTGNLTGVIDIAANADLSVIGNLTVGTAGTVTVGGELKVTGNLTLTGATTGALAVTGVVDIETLTLGAANVIGVGGGTIGEIILHTTATPLNATFLTIGKLTGLATAKTLVISGMVVLPGANTIGTDVTVENVIVSGANVALGNITGLAANQTITLGVIVDTELVPGRLSIGGTVAFSLVDDTSVIGLMPGGKLSVAVGADILDTNHGNVKLGVLDREIPPAFSKALVTAAPDSVITVDETGSASTDVILGKIKFSVVGSGTGETSGADAGGSAAAGSLTAGEDTYLALAGTT